MENAIQLTGGKSVGFTGPFEVRMMPGQEPYTPAELKLLYKLVDEAARADEWFSPVELEDEAQKNSH